MSSAPKTSPDSNEDRDRIDEVMTWIVGVLLIGGLLVWLVWPLVYG